MNSVYFWPVPVAAIIALVFAWVFFKQMMKGDEGDPTMKILIVDDVLATGGTAAATGRLVETLGGDIVGFGFLIELGDLQGRKALGDHRVESLTTF